MASDVMSLFGMDPRVIQQNRVQSGVDNASRMSADFAIGAAGGGLAAAGINSAFGLQTPDMAQAASVQSGLAGQNLNTVAGLRAAAQQLMMNGDYAQAMALHAQARDMEASELKASNEAADRAFGTVRTAKLMDGVDLEGNPVTTYREIRYTNNGQVFDLLTGENLTGKIVEEDTPNGTNNNNNNLVWDSSTGTWKDNRTAPAVEEVVPELSEAQQSTIKQLEERLKITPKASPEADQIQAAIDNVNAAGEETAIAGSGKKKKQIAYHVKTIEESRNIISMYTKSDGTIMQTSKVGRAQQNLRNALKQIYNITGKDYTPEDYPVETTEK